MISGGICIGKVDDVVDNEESELESSDLLDYSETDLASVFY